MTNKNNNKFNRYHLDVYVHDNFPDMVVEFINTFNNEINLTDHAADEMYSDKRGMIPLPTKEEILHKDSKIIEYYEKTAKPGRMQKVVFRLNNLNENYDYTYVVARGGVVVTCWANDKGDNHRLNESKELYVQPPENTINT